MKRGRDKENVRMNAEYRQRRREYRERQPGRRIAGFTLLAAAAVAALSFLLFYSSTRASSLEAPEREHKYYTSVTVAFGQDMDALVDEYYSPAHYAGTESYSARGLFHQLRQYRQL